MSADTGDFTRDPLIRAYAALLRSYRESMSLSRAKFAEALGCSPGWIEKLENCEKPPSEATSDDLDTFFKLPARTFHTMWAEIKREGKQSVGPPGFQEYVRREAKASMLTLFAAMVLDGLFQTPEYAREVLRVGRSAEEAEELLVTRLARQEIFQRPGLAQISIVIDEGILHRPTGGRAVMKEQLEHLIARAEDPRVTLQIVPISKGAYQGNMGAFNMLGFEHAPDVVYVEGHTSGQLLEDPREVRGHTLAFNLIRGAALSADQSLELLHEMVESYGQGERDGSDVAH
ncbi:helix-turn-helix domain-containing protein [Actinomadura violacea]|uniref:Helix-turn-helix transcriptional regulator n=1 Tax=Actinomadura violacea TaxID=2819934 RepID=A0ABS3S112_9ACTN|nr:helix-turn-helix transcriptional regulator [Actinomadura violacea]MBO2462686.1 helix-turn-helix transcriptional regulator [Actinomadura violacea]